MSQAPDLQSGFSRDYVAFMRCDAGEGWLPKAESQIASWLRKKDLDLPVDREGDLAKGSTKVTIRRDEAAGATDLRLLMSEQNPGGRFECELVAHDEPGGSDWVSLTVRNRDGGFVEVPNVAKYLMEVLSLGDGAVRFTAQPQLLRHDDVAWLLEVLADDERHSLVFVAGTDGQLPLKAFEKKIALWARRVFGLAQVFVLDPAATEEFARRAGPRFGAHPWTLRTYRPGVRFDSDLDARRHRFLSTRSLADQSDGRISYLLGDIARNHAANRAEPVAVQRVRRRFERLENRRIAATLETASEVASPPAAVEPPAPPAKPHGPVAKVRAEVGELALVKRVLDLKEITEVGLREIASRLAHAVSLRDSMQDLRLRLDGMQERVELLEEELEEAAELLKSEQTDHEIAEIERDEARDRVTWLTARLKEAGDYEAAYAEVPPEYQTERPADFDELLERIEEIPGIEFTGDPDVVVRLGAIDTNNAAIRVAWNAVLVLADYVKARGCGDWDGGLEQFIEATPPGYIDFPPGKFASTETGTTMRSFGKEREFPVPLEVDASGRRAMKAHFKLASIGRKHPRMHVYDAHPHQPLVCIGYIGPHLTNTQT